MLVDDPLEYPDDETPEVSAEDVSDALLPDEAPDQVSAEPLAPVSLGRAGSSSRGWTCV